MAAEAPPPGSGPRQLSALEEEAVAVLDATFGSRPEAVAAGAAPGRCTIVGEHVDYADGLVVCIAVDMGVAAALRPSGDGSWRVVSGSRRAERVTSVPAGDVADRPLAALEALRAAGVALPPVDVALAASLPEGAGLSSSAALSVAVLVAALRLVRRRLPAQEVARIALVAERDILGVPCGPLDQRAVVGAPAGGALLLDCRQGGEVRLPWLPEAASLVVCDTGEVHDVGGAGYRTRREQADEALRLLGAPSWREVTPAQVGAAGLPEPLDRRARHIVSETARAAEAAGALRAGDTSAVGALMSASHASLRDDYEVSTPGLDAAVAAALASPGCFGARLVGAGFGGSATALVEEAAAGRCAAAMRAAVPTPGSRAWVVAPAAGAAETARDVIA